jgi:hypothetical protein
VKELPWTVPGGQQVQFTPYRIGGRNGADAEVIGTGAIQSENYVASSAGWRINGNGSVEFQDGEFRGDIVGASIDIGTGNDSWHVDSDGNMWAGHADFVSAPVQISKAGVLNASGGFFSGAITATSGSFTGIVTASTFTGNNTLSNASFHNIESDNYSAGTAGWSIAGNGDAEFNDIVARGTISTAISGERIEVGTSGFNFIDFYTGDGDEQDNGYINVDVDNSGADDFGYINVVAPSFEVSAPTRCYIDLRHYESGDRAINMYADQVAIVGATLSVGDRFEETSASFNTNWSDYGGSYATVSYWRDAWDRVTLQGLITRSTSTSTSGDVMFTLAAGNRPASTLIFPVVTSIGAGEIRIFSSGAVASYDAIPSGGWVSVSGVVFDT